MKYLIIILLATCSKEDRGLVQKHLQTVLNDKAEIEMVALSEEEKVTEPTEKYYRLVVFYEQAKRCGADMKELTPAAIDKWKVALKNPGALKVYDGNDWDAKLTEEGFKKVTNAVVVAPMEVPR